MRLQDISGQKFGELTVLHRVPSKNLHTYWLCLCSCGNSKAIAGASLKRGASKSCGCVVYEGENSSNFKHGHSYKNGLRAISPTYFSWYAMVQRCTNPNDIGWHRYGGRGIKVCDHWKNFANFLSDMGERPKGKTIDRYPDNNGNYEPENCRWATPKEQAANRRRPFR